MNLLCLKDHFSFFQIYFVTFLFPLASTEPKEAEIKTESGGIAQFFVEHREVSWLALIAVLVWGAVAYTKLGQQEDPTIPQRTAMLVTIFPGATASKVEELVAKPLERKISELDSIEEIKTTVRPSVVTMNIKQLPASKAKIDQEWDKVRSKIAEVQLPDGTRQPWLNTDFGNTITLLFGLVSPPITDAECVARLRAAGAVVLGKTVTTEFAFYAPGKTRNPHDLARTPGGSSGGSAAAMVRCSRSAP